MGFLRRLLAPPAGFGTSGRSLAFLLVRYTHHNFPLFLIRYDIVWLLVNLHRKSVKYYLVTACSECQISKFLARMMAESPFAIRKIR